MAPVYFASADAPKDRSPLIYSRKLQHLICVSCQPSLGNLITPIQQLARERLARKAPQAGPVLLICGTSHTTTERKPV